MRSSQETACGRTARRSFQNRHAREPWWRCRQNRRRRARSCWIPAKKRCCNSSSSSSSRSLKRRSGRLQLETRRQQRADRDFFALTFVLEQDDRIGTKLRQHLPARAAGRATLVIAVRSEEHTSELQ